MAYEKKTAKIVVMVAPSMKQELEDEARNNDTELSVIVREAIKRRNAEN